MSIKQKINDTPWYKKLKVLRIIKGWTQEETAKKCGVDKRIFWNWENGISIPIKKNRERIGKVFNVTEEEIFGDIYKTA